jgi:hypothetical protein
MAHAKNIAQSQVRMQRQKKEREEKKEAFLKKNPFGKTYEEQKKAYENLVEMILLLKEKVG